MQNYLLLNLNKTLSITLLTSSETFVNKITAPKTIVNRVLRVKISTTNCCLFIKLLAPHATRNATGTITNFKEKGCILNLKSIKR